MGVLHASRRLDETVNVAMVRSGMAWWYRRYGSRGLKFSEAEAEARSRRRGLWKDGDRAKAPWDYRAEQRRNRQRGRILRRVVGWLMFGAVVAALGVLAWVIYGRV